MRPDSEAMEDDGWEGRVLDERYRILGVLGEGGMGRVFVGEHVKLRRRVAIKTIVAELAHRPEVAARFEREARATAHLDHPNIVGVLDYGSLADGTAYLVSQLIEGPSLSEKIAQDGRIDWREACRIGADVAAGVAAAHAHGIVHRDLKPENVLLAPQVDGPPIAKVLDFGIARVIGDALGADAQATLTRHGMVLGTPGYMAPEQALGQPAHPRVDVYALGVILFEMLTGRAPYASDSGLTNLVSRQLTESLPDLEEAMDGRPLPPALVALVRSMLEPEPARRSVDLAAVRDGLTELASSAESLAAAPTPEPAGDVPASADRDRTLLVPIVAVLALALAAIGASVLAGDSEERPPVIGSAASPTSGASTGAGLEPDVDVLIHGPSAEARNAAAHRLLHSGALAPLPRALVQLELATTCRGRREAVAALRAVGDPRALPAIERWRAQPETGCPAAEPDCNGCMTEALRAAQIALQGG